MKGTDPITARLATAADITPEWLALVAAPLASDGQAFRASAHAACIEIQSLHTGEWMPLNLPTNGHLFASRARRDATYIVLANAVSAAANRPA